MASPLSFWTFVKLILDCQHLHGGIHCILDIPRNLLGCLQTYAQNSHVNVHNLFIYIIYNTIFKGMAKLA